MGRAVSEDWYDDSLPPLPPKWSAPLSYEGLGPVFTATYESECTSCDEPIAPGEDARADGSGGWIHADTMCEKAAEQPRRNPALAVLGKGACSRCFCHHAGEC